MRSLSKMMYYDNSKKEEVKGDNKIGKPPIRTTSPDIIEMFKGVASKDIKEAQENDKTDKKTDK